MTEQQFENYILVSGKYHEVKEGYNLKKTIDETNVNFELLDDKNKLITSFNLSDLNETERYSPPSKGGTANHRLDYSRIDDQMESRREFNHIKKTKQIKNKSVKKLREFKPFRTVL